MLSTMTKATAGAKTAKTFAQNPLLRSAVTQAGPPIAKLSVTAGKKRMSRKGRKQLEQMGDALGTVASLTSTYAPRAALAAQELGLVEAPKPKRTAPRLLAGVLIGAIAMLLLEPGHGREHRQQVQRLIGQG